MDFDLFEKIFTLLCNGILAFSALIAITRYVIRETYFGDEAVYQHKELEKETPKRVYEFKGGSSKIFPQIIIERRLFGKKTVTYYIEEDNKRMVKVYKK